MVIDCEPSSIPAPLLTQLWFQYFTEKEVSLSRLLPAQCTSFDNRKDYLPIRCANLFLLLDRERFAHS